MLTINPPEPVSFKLLPISKSVGTYTFRIKVCLLITLCVTLAYMPEVPANSLQKHAVTDLVIGQLRELGEMNPGTSDDQDHVFRQKLETIINRSKVVEYTGGLGENSDLFQLLDKDGNPIPILVKVVKGDRQEDADRIEKTHTRYIELLGPEFVEDITRVTITNRQILSNYPQNKRIEAFVQDLRALDGKKSLFQFLLENNPKSISPNRKRQTALFLERVLDAYVKGYAADLGAFPWSPSDELENDIRANVLIDTEGISLIDSGLIIEVADDNRWKGYFSDLKTACLLFSGTITPSEAYERTNRLFSQQFNYQVDDLQVETLNSEVDALKESIKSI